MSETATTPELPEFDASCNVCGRLVQLRKLTGWQWAHTTLSHVPDHLAVPTHVRLASQPWPNLDTGDTIARLAEDRRNRAGQ